MKLSKLTLITVLVLGLAFVCVGCGKDQSKVPQSVVKIEKVVNGEVVGHGTGFAAFEKGVIVTAKHIVDGIDSFIITDNRGYVYHSQHYEMHETVDVAIIRVKAMDLPLLPIGDYIGVDQDVYVYGYPMDRKMFYCEGIVGEHGGGQIYVSMSIAPGHSGGPLMTSNGYVIGICSWHYRYNNPSIACFEQVRLVREILLE